MKKTIKYPALVLLLALCIPLHADPPEGAVYLEGNKPVGLILAHGRGEHPRWRVVEPLRIDVNEQLGLHTLSLQMPNDDKHWESYAGDFPMAYQIFEDAIRFYREEKNINSIFLMGHSMGSRMASAFVATSPNSKLGGLIIAGCRNNGGPPLDCKNSVVKVKIPVLDIWGQDNGKDQDAARERKDLVSATYKQVAVPDTSHKFIGEEQAFTAAVINWLKTQLENKD